MRFSLATLLLLVLWIGALMAVWAQRDAWVKISQSKIEFSDAKEFFSWYDQLPRNGLFSPDRTREILPSCFSKITIVDPETYAQLAMIGNSNNSILPLRFADNDTLLVVENVASFATYHRRFPEWWWGHFYRPEVWLAMALTALLVWRAVVALRLRRAARLLLQPVA